MSDLAQRVYDPIFAPPVNGLAPLPSKPAASGRPVAPQPGH